MEFNCPMCGKTLRIPEEHYGLAGTCNYCKHHVTLKPVQLADGMLEKKPARYLYDYLRQWYDAYWRRPRTES